MPAKPLTQEQKSEAQALKQLFNAWKSKNKTTQEDALEPLGFGQSALSQYLNGKIPLNPTAAWKFAQLLGCDIADFSPSVHSQIQGMPFKGEALDVKTSAREAPGVLDRATPTETPEPVQPSPTLGATIIQLGALLAALSPMGLKSVASLLEDVLKNPALAADAAATADAIAKTQRLPVSDDFVSGSFGRAQARPVETGFTPLEETQ